MNPSARLAGDTLIVSRDADLPLVCMKCGSHREITCRPRPFQWTPVWARFLMVCVVGLIVMLIVTKRATLSIPLCAPCEARWTTARSASVAVVVALVVSFIAMRTMDNQLLGMALLIAALTAFLVVTLTYVRPRVLRVKRIDAAEIHLAGVHSTAATEIIACAAPAPPPATT